MAVAIAYVANGGFYHDTYKNDLEYISLRPVNYHAPPFTGDESGFFERWNDDDSGAE